MTNCPRCDSPKPHLHPAMQFEGEVQTCTHDFHLRETPQNTPAYIEMVQKARGAAYTVWYARAKSALKHRGRVHQIISRRVGDLNRAARQSGTVRFWEYHRVTSWMPTTAALNELGAQGWELVGFTRAAEFIFKRPINTVESKD